jgi:Uma2 family endonuclease
MTQAKPRFATFEEYLTWSDDPENYREGRYELIDGALVDVPGSICPGLALTAEQILNAG